SLKLPHSILIPLLTAFRVIPLIREKGSDKIFTLKLKNEIHSHKNFFTRLQSYRKLLLPLIVESLILARKLAVVLDLRGFRKEGSLPISRKKSITFSESLILMFLGIFFISYILFQKRIM
ncbi:MAG: hypothetical protein PHV06_05230, partial [bacterium]|nr:hypothetical protein [bacterium]